MIIDFNVDYNNYEDKILNNYGFWNYNCPYCNCNSALIRHGNYQRNICIFINTEIIPQRITILRLLCNACNHTHAILPANTIPYSFYSNIFILNILTQYFCNDTSATKIAKDTNTSHQIIYFYINQYIINLCSCISFLRIYLNLETSFNSSPKYILNIINLNFILWDFLKQYLIHTKKIFLMRKRRNILSNQVLIGY
jgi:hypothetical protein